jgi:alkanesulfonate monooxygenase SsuD/methylene tetrahydromethanopterin reductase-like flavin-dependent oxidoreductase (luciferase family)
VHGTIPLHGHTELARNRHSYGAAMKVDGGLPFELDKAADAAKEAEGRGYDAVWTAETSHDPFFPLLLAAGATERVELGTGIAVAFARSPMTLANIGYDLQRHSGGGSSSASGRRSSLTSPSGSRCRGPTRRPACGS